MTKSTIQYDHIGAEYDEYAQVATMKRAEKYTFLQMIKSVQGQSVLDLTCGFGYYTRILKIAGAAEVVGVDISPEMIALAQAQEKQTPLGITYQVNDVLALPPQKPSGLITAIYLLNYATSPDELIQMLDVVYRNLKTGGRFIA